MGIERINEFWPEWHIGGVLGEGSFGKVYSAEKTLAGCTTTAAIKVISIPSSKAELDALESEGMSEEETTDYFKEIVDDFINEIKLMITLKGAPNIVSVEDYNILPCKDRFGWEIFIRMERLTSFKDYQKTHTMTVEDIVKLGCDISNALEICQQRNIIHRDIKPANIFIDDFGNFKLGDFGVAKQLGKTTGAASAKGTFSYMAPEVTRGDRYDQSVDIYSLGLVLYSLLNNNRPPFIDPQAVKVGYNERSEANNRRLHGEPLPPLANVSPDLSNAILTACSYLPQTRFKSATAFKRALQSCDINKKQKVIISRKTEDIDRTVSVRSANSLTVPPSNDNTPRSIRGKTSKLISKRTVIITAVILIPTLLLIGAIGFVIAGRYFAFFELEKVGGTTVVYWRGEITVSGEGGIPNNFFDKSDIMLKYKAHAKSLVIKEGITVIPPEAFNKLSKIESVTLPSTLTEIRESAFEYCESLKEITIPDSVEVIGDEAFSGCTNLEEIKLSDNLEELGDMVFNDCSSLEEITIPEDVDDLYLTCFIGCTDLETIYINNSNIRFLNNHYRPTADLKIKEN